MSQFIESLKRLYMNKKITDSILKGLLESKKITEKELNYILRKEDE